MYLRSIDCQPGLGSCTMHLLHRSGMSCPLPLLMQHFLGRSKVRDHGRRSAEAISASTGCVRGGECLTLGARRVNGEVRWNTSGLNGGWNLSAVKKSILLDQHVSGA